MDPAAILNRVRLRLEARDIPVPAHISEAARSFLATAGMAPRQKIPPSPSEAWWRAAIEAWNQRMLPMLAPLLSELPVHVQTRVVGACRVYVATPDSLKAAAEGHALIDIHGGALVFGAGRFAQWMAMWRAASLGCRVFGVDYRVPPDHPYPAALDDCLGVYDDLLARYRPEDIALCGISAGGNLAAAMLLRARDEGRPLPAACILLTPESDLTESGDSFATIRDIDVALPEPLPETVKLYAGDADPGHPYLSPLFGDFGPGFPPSFLQSGTRDIYLSNTVRLHRALLNAGQKAELHVWEAMPHAGFGGAAPEDQEMNAAMKDFLVRTAGWVL